MPGARASLLLPLCSICSCPAGAGQLLQLDHHQALLLPLGERCRAPHQWGDAPSPSKRPAPPSPLPPLCGTAEPTFFSAPLGEPQHQNVALQKRQWRSRAMLPGGLRRVPARGLEPLWDSVGRLEPACSMLGAVSTAPPRHGFLNKGVLSPLGLICANGAAGPAVTRCSLRAAPGSLQPPCLPFRRLDLHQARAQAGSPVPVPVIAYR